MAEPQKRPVKRAATQRTGKPAGKVQTPPPRLQLLMDDQGDVRAVYAWNTYRFLMSDGRTVDVIAIRDDSDLRAEVLRYCNMPQDKPQEGRIEGVAYLGPAG